MKKIFIFLEVLTFFICINSYNACMEEIKVMGYSITPSFDTNIYKYNVYISGNSITIKGKGSGKIEGLGTFDSLNDINDYYVKCDNKEYLIRAFKNTSSIKSDNAYLSNLNIIGYDIDFKKDVFEYSIDKEGNILVKYELENPASTLEYIEYDNKIEIEVISEDKSKKNTYIINVNKIKNVSKVEENSLKNNELNDYQKCGVIFYLGIILLTIMCFLNKLMFK